jgi:hypothetical protein
MDGNLNGFKTRHHEKVYLTGLCPVSMRYQLTRAIADLPFEATNYFGISSDTVRKCKKGIAPNFYRASFQRLSNILL